MYNQLFPENITSTVNDLIHNVSHETRDKLVEMETIDNSTQLREAIIVHKPLIEKVTYAQMLDASKELLSTVQNDQLLMKSVLSSISEWTNHLRVNQEVGVTFHSSIIPQPQHNGLLATTKMPISSITTKAHYKKMNKRLKPSHEFHKGIMNVKSPTINLLCEDSQFTSKVTMPNKRKVNQIRGTKSCGLCGNKKHFQYNCPYLCDDDIDGKAIACQFKVKASREAISEELFRTNSFVKRRPVGDTRIVLPSMPKYIFGLQIHKKYYVDFDEEYLDKDINNVCVECTIIDKGGVKKSQYTRVLFKPVHVNQFVGKSVQNLVCSWMTV